MRPSPDRRSPHSRYCRVFWAVTQVGAQDNFFTLGGHSLLGAQLIAQDSGKFRSRNFSAQLFEEPTVRGMSAEIERLIHARLACHD